MDKIIINGGVPHMEITLYTQVTSNINTQEELNEIGDKILNTTNFEVRIPEKDISYRFNYNGGDTYYVSKYRFMEHVMTRIVDFSQIMDILQDIFKESNGEENG